MGKFININNSRELLGDLISDALNQGADAADAIWVKNTSTTTTCRMGKLEKLNDSDEEQLGLRVFIGKRQSIVSSSDCSPKAFKEIIDKSLMMAKTLPEDPFVGIADKADLVTNKEVARLNNVGAQIFRVQLLSVRKKESAETEWKRLSKRYSQILSGLKSYVIRADLGARGIYYRLQAGAFKVKSTATKVCTKLAQVKISCFVIKQDN